MNTINNIFNTTVDNVNRTKDNLNNKLDNVLDNTEKTIKNSINDMTNTLQNVETNIEGEIATLSNKRVTNNKYHNCPARMDDGRHFTNYLPNVSINEQLQNNNNIHSDSDKYREFLTKNAESIIKNNQHEMNVLNSCVCISE